MTYRFDSSERTTSPGNVMETKALLYLIDFDENGDDIFGFAIDCFNDVTGMDKDSLKLYDVQSKARKSGPREIGKELVTLFHNYTSTFREYFIEEILFLGNITSTVLEDESLGIFRFRDMFEDAQMKVRAGLIEACKEKEYVAEGDVNEEQIDGFLSDVLFVIAKQNNADYISPLVKATELLPPTDAKLIKIFNEIRKAQANFKNKPSIAGKRINKPNEVYNFGRVFKRREIELMVISRLINGNPLEAGIPTSFLPYLRTQEEGDEDEVIEDCQLDFSTQICDKNSTQAFWDLWGEIVTAIDNDGSASVDQIYDSIAQETHDACIHLSPLSTKYFIAFVKDRMK